MVVLPEITLTIAPGSNPAPVMLTVTWPLFPAKLGVTLVMLKGITSASIVTCEGASGMAAPWIKMK